MRGWIAAIPGERIRSLNHTKRLIALGAALALLLLLVTASASGAGVSAGAKNQADLWYDTDSPAAAISSARLVSPSPQTCDTGLALDSLDPVDAARAIDICKLSTGPGGWGLVSASWVMADGSAVVPNPNYALGHGLLSGFGPNVAVRQGDRLLALSSGSARQPTDPGYIDPANYGFDKQYTGNHPTGFPKAAFSCLGACPAGGEPHDVVALRLDLRPPPNAYAFSFDWKFYTPEYPTYVCSVYNDLFLAILDPAPPGHSDGNIAFDAYGNPVSVNAAFLEVCTRDPAAACYTCPLGTAELEGTGFEGRGATAWQTATADVEPGLLISLRLAVYDSEDGLFDSMALIDNFQWLTEPFRIWLPLLSK